MAYAHRKDIYDADTHMMEHPNWIYDFASEDVKEHLEPIVEGDKEVFERIDRLRFVNSCSSSKSGRGQILISFSNKGRSLRSDITSKGLSVTSVSTSLKYFCRVGSNFKRLIAAFAICFGLTYLFLSSRETIVF